MKISVCVAIYNIKETYLRACLDTVTADKSADMEIILGDDCSTNGNEKICCEYAAADKRIKHLRPKFNGGESRIRNMMIDAASGDYIVFVDGDDVVADNFGEGVIKAADSGRDIVMYEWRHFTDTVPPTDPTAAEVVPIDDKACRIFSRSCITGAPPQTERFGINNCTPSSVCTKAYRRDFIVENGIRFKPGLKKSQDVVFNTEAFFKCASLGYYPKGLYFYRANPTSICHRYSADFEEIIDEYMGYDLENMKKFFPDDPECGKEWGKYKIISCITDNFKLNIFHRDNPNSARERRADFLKFIGSQPFAEFFENFDFSSYAWHERRLVLRLAKRKNFAALDFLYKHPIWFRVYGGVKSRLG